MFTYFNWFLYSIHFSTKFCWGKTLVNWSFQSLVSKTSAKFNVLYIWNLAGHNIGEWHSFHQIHRSFPPPEFCTIQYIFWDIYYGQMYAIVCLLYKSQSEFNRVHESQSWHISCLKHALPLWLKKTGTSM